MPVEELSAPVEASGVEASGVEASVDPESEAPVEASGVVASGVEASEEAGLSVDGVDSVGDVEPGTAAPPSCSVAGSGLLDGVEQATRLPDKSSATAARDIHFLFMIELPFRLLHFVPSFGHVSMVAGKSDQSVWRVGKNHEQDMKKI